MQFWSKIVFFGIILFNLFRCAMPQPVHIEPTIPVEKMAGVLADIHLAEAVLSDMRDGIQKDSTAAVYYHTILKLHTVSSAAFEQSIKAYTTNPMLYKNLYQKVKENLENLEKKHPNLNTTPSIPNPVHSPQDKFKKNKPTIINK